MKILILTGGKSAEREISLKSATNVATALTKLNHEVVTYDLINGLGGVKDQVAGIDVVFPIIHGEEGEDGQVQAVLDSLGVKYLGANARVSKLCFDKVAFKQRLRELGIQTPDWEIVTRDTIDDSALLRRAFVLKPVASGSSIDTFIIRQPKDFERIYEAFERHQEMLLEELIEGAEITVGVVGDRALPVVEIQPPYGEEFDYTNKYNGKTKELCPPRNVSTDIQQRAQALALRIHTELGVDHLSRTDIIVTPEGKLQVLEINTMPGLTDQSLLPKAAVAADLDFEGLVAHFVKLATATSRTSS